jgi:hypothetical protein
MTAFAPLLAVCALAWPDLTLHALVGAAAVFWRIRRNRTQQQEQE